MAKESITSMRLRRLIRVKTKGDTEEKISGLRVRRKARLMVQSL